MLAINGETGPSPPAGSLLSGSAGSHRASASAPSASAPHTAGPISSPCGTPPRVASDPTAPSRRRLSHPGLQIPVGTALAGGPPDRSQRALLVHWAPTLGAGVESDVRPGMRDAGGREPPRFEPAHPVPGQAVALAPAPQRPTPVPRNLLAECRHGVDVAGNRVVGDVSAHHAAQPVSLLGDG